MNYFQDYNNELSLLNKGNGHFSPGGRYTFRLMRNYNDVNRILNNEPNTIAVILNIEGGHSLGTGSQFTREMAVSNPDSLQKSVIQNILQLKKQPYPVFSITFANHYFNQLCGQTRTNSGMANLVMHSEKEGQCDGITPLGYCVLRELLSDKNGSRILIDIKYMSLISRINYYDLLQKEYENSVPILYSHGGVNGLPSMKQDIKWSEKKQTWIFNKDKKRDNNKSYLNRWSVNLYNDEIRLIHKSNGLVGIMLEGIRIGGKKAMNMLNNTIDGSMQQRDEFIKLVMANAFQIVKAVGDSSAWDMIAISSDFDGSKSPISCFKDASRYVDFRHAVEEFLQRVKDKILILNKENYLFTNDEVITLLYNYSSEIIADKLLAQNTLNFLERNFK